MRCFTKEEARLELDAPDGPRLTVLFTVDLPGVDTEHNHCDRADYGRDSSDDLRLSEVKMQVHSDCTFV